jgi:type IV pilus assembly protein PilB
MAARSLRDLYDEFRAANGIRDNRPGKILDEGAMSKLMQLFLAFGVQVKASDIHLEPIAAGARVRYRIDGILHDMLTMSPEMRDPLLRAIKVRAGMNNDGPGRSKPQDSRFDFEAEGHNLDLRLSSFPTIFGDVIAIRILDRSRSLFKLEDLGFPSTVLKTFEALIKRPNGFVLVTGPTGVGKTTTLYAALNKIRSPRIKMVTLEDPVEYQMDGVNQGQINTAVGLTFATGLRAILRQDADVILVGEIRDKETAEIGIRAALTGHLVLSTMHARHSLGATTRLLDMGVEPHMILASVTGIVAQRLVRLVCRQCRHPDRLATENFERIWAQETGGAPLIGELRLVKGQGCVLCNGTGYVGRLGLFELLVLTDDLRQLILERATHHIYRGALSGSKLRTMLVDGLEKAAQGMTTLEEVLRVMDESEMEDIAG